VPEAIAMTTRQTEPVLRRVRRALLVREDGVLTDRELLGCYIARRDDAAFEALVRRHGPMVLGVCRRVLRDPHDAEDAFQAVFLVLLRKAASLRQRELVGNWLYGVAHRTALEARSMRSRRNSIERQVPAMPEPAVREPDASPDLLPLLDEEILRLPDKYRLPVVLCELEGRSRRDVARQLGIPEGTLSSRLAAARKRLAVRLARRGLGLSAVALTALLQSASSGVPTPLVISTLQTAAELSSNRAVTAAHVALLSERVVKSMFLTRLRLVSTWLIALIALVSLLGLLPFALQVTGLQAQAPPRISRQAAERPPQQAPAVPEQGEDVLALKYSPDGKWLAIAQGGGGGEGPVMVRLWDTKSNRPARTLPGPDKWVRGLCFTPNGETLAGCCDDGKIYLWDTGTGELRKSLEGHRGTPQAIAIAADGKILASSSLDHENGVVTATPLKIWDLTDGKLLREIESPDGPDGTGTGLAFAPKGNLLGVACARAFRGVRLVDVTTGKEVQRLPYDAGFPLAVAFSPDGRWLASGGGDALPISPQESKLIGHVKVWDRKTGRLHNTLIDPTDGYFRAIAFSRDSKHLFSGCPGPIRPLMRDGRQIGTRVVNQIRCWESARWEQRWSAEGDLGEVWALDVSLDGRTVVASDGWGVRLLDVATGQWIRPLLVSPHKPKS
jgi:RNA polymerase sigma factor (sigma-70 family)